MTRPTLTVFHWNRTKDPLAAELYSPLHLAILNAYPNVPSVGAQGQARPEEHDRLASVANSERG